MLSRTAVRAGLRLTLPVVLSDRLSVLCSRTGARGRTPTVRPNSSDIRDSSKNLYPESACVLSLEGCDRRRTASDAGQVDGAVWRRLEVFPGGIVEWCTPLLLLSSFPVVYTQVMYTQVMYTGLCTHIPGTPPVCTLRTVYPVCSSCQPGRRPAVSWLRILFEHGRAGHTAPGSGMLWQMSGRRTHLRARASILRIT